MPRTVRFDPEKIRAAFAGADGSSRAARARAVCEALKCSPGTVARALKGRTGDSSSRSPTGPSPIERRRVYVLPVGHPATVEKRTLYPTMVRDVDAERLLKPGDNSGKIGGEVRKGPWKGFPIYTLTLEERATCPTSCQLWASCLIPETPVLTSDFRWVPIGEVKVGDRLAGFDEEGALIKGKQKYRMTRITTVEAVGRIAQPCFRIVTDRGVVTASAPHLWLRRRSRLTYKWYPTNKLKVGDKLLFFSEPWQTDKSYDAGRLRGFVEGEGYCCLFGNGGYKNTRTGWSQRPTKLCDEIIEVASRLGFETARYERIAGAASTAVSHVDIRGGWKETVRFLGRIRPTRMIEKAEEVWKNHAITGRASRYATVLSIEEVGSREVVTIQTSTRTLVAQGFFTHNCYGNNMPFARRWRPGPALEWRLEREVPALELEHPRGFAVRLHSLGDFYSVGYVRLWRRLLESCTALRIFGYTARIDTMGCEIAYEIALLVRDYWTRMDPPRFAVRFSNAPVGERSTVTLESPVQLPERTTICPAQWTPSGKKSESCSTCGLCWDTPRRIAFLRH